MKLINLLKGDINKRNYFIMTVAVFLLLADYLIFCSITGKNIFNIFPGWPLREEFRYVNVYYPWDNEELIIKEDYSVPDSTRGLDLCYALFGAVIDGAYSKNTRRFTPDGIYLKKVWIYSDSNESTKAVFDIGVKRSTVKNADYADRMELLKRAISYTVRDNIPQVAEVIFLENGV